MIKNDYIPFSSKILEVIQHTNIEYTFRMEYQGDVKPGQFFEVSIPKSRHIPDKHRKTLCWPAVERLSSGHL